MCGKYAYSNSDLIIDRDLGHFMAVIEFLPLAKADYLTRVGLLGGAD